MNIFWAGGEDIDFPTIGGFGVSTTAGRFRSSFARCAMSSPTASGATAKSNTFGAGAQTSAWLSAQIIFGPSAPGGQVRMIAFGLGGTEKGLGIGTAAASGTKLCIFKWDGTTRTELVAEAGNSINLNSLVRIDMQVVSYGASATVTLYAGGISVATFTGNVAVTGMSNFDSVFLYANGSGLLANIFQISEIVVADSDTRAIQGLQTMALTGQGTTNNWSSNTFTNVNNAIISDTTPTFTNATAQDQQYTITHPSPASYAVAAVKISARMAEASSTPTQVKLGYNSGGTVAFGTGAAKTLSTAYVNYEQYDAINPVTGVAFVAGDMAALQLDLQSA